MSTTPEEPTQAMKSTGPDWSGGQVAHDQEEHVDPVGEDSESGWGADQAVRDQDEQPDDEPTGWSGDQVVTDLGTDQA